MVMVRSIRSVKFLDIVLTLPSAGGGGGGVAAAGVVAVALSRLLYPIDFSAAVSLILVRVSSC